LLAFLELLSSLHQKRIKFHGSLLHVLIDRSIDRSIDHPFPLLGWTRVRAAGLFPISRLPIPLHFADNAKPA
jgi:hypothetical protein